MNKNYINIIRNELTKSSDSLSDADYKEAMDFLTKIEENNDLLKNVYKNLQKMFEEKDSVQKRIDDAFEVTKEFFNVKEPINAEGYSNVEKGAYIKDLMDELRTSYTNDKADIAMPYAALETLIKGWDAISHGKESLTFIRPDAEQLEQAFENGDWTFDEMIKGYGEFTSSELPSDVLVINKIDDMMVFDSDADAAVQANKDGIKLIPVHHLHFEDPEDIRAYYESVFIDNEINREFLKDSLITDERQVLNNAIEFFKNDKGVEALELPGELLNAAEVYESSIEDRKTLFIDPVSGNKLLVEDATNGYLTNLFDKNNTLIDHDSFTGYKKEEDGYSTDAMSRFEAGLVTMQAFQQLGIWGDYHNFNLSRNQNIINELEEEIKNSFDNNDFDIGTKEYLGNLLSASMETLDFKPNEWKFLINSGASCSAALHTAASDAYLGDNLMWLLDNIPEPELDKIRKNEKLSLEIVRIAEDSIMNDSNFSVKPTLILAEKLGQLNHAVEYISDLYDKNKDEYQNDQNFTKMYNELTDYAHKVNWTIHYVDRIPDEDNDTYSNRFDIEIYNDDEYLRDSLHLDDDSIFNGHFNVSLVVDVPENFNSLNIQELKLSDIDVSYIRIEDKENGYPEEQDIILKEDLLSLFKSNVIQTLRELEQIHDSKLIYIDNPRSNREQIEVNTSLNLYYNNELKDEIDKGNHLINDNAWIGYFKISDSLKYEIVTGSYDGNTIIDLRPTVDTNINNLKGINGKGKINDEEVHVEYRDPEDKEINLDSHWISYAWKDLENLNSNQIKEKFIKDIETHINDSKVLPSLACDYKDFERPYDISLAEIENINKLYKDATNILSKLKTVEDARECEKHYGVLVEIGCDAAGGGLHCTDSLFDNVKPENIEWFRFEQWEELEYIYYPTDGSKPRFDYYRTGEEEALIEDITIDEFNQIYKKEQELSFREAYCLDPKPAEILTKENAVALVNLFEKNKPGNEYPIFDLPAAQKIIEYFEAEDYVIYKDEEGNLCIYDNSEDFNGEGDIYSNKEFLKFARSLAEKAEELGYEVYTEGSKKLLEKITKHYEELDLQNKHISQEENAEKYLQTVKSLLPESENINRKTIREVLIASEKAKNILKEAHTESYVQEWEKQKRKKYPEKNNDFGREN